MSDVPENMLRSCGGCDARWYGPLRCHCSVCHVTVDDESLWNQHRVDGECRWPGSLGLTRDRGGVWVSRVQRIG